jgi:hypothetical protein
MKFTLGKMDARRAMRGSALLLAFLAAPIASHAQSVTLFGSLYNFDVLNDTGQDTHGFEIELNGITPAQVLYSFPATRYAGATITAFPGGTYVRWQSPWDRNGDNQMKKLSRLQALMTIAVLALGTASVASADHGGNYKNAETRLRTRLAGATIQGQTPEGNADFRTDARGRSRSLYPHGSHGGIPFSFPFYARTHRTLSSRRLLLANTSCQQSKAD